MDYLDWETYLELAHDILESLKKHLYLGGIGSTTEESSCSTFAHLILDVTVYFFKGATQKISTAVNAFDNLTHPENA